MPASRCTTDQHNAMKSDEVTANTITDDMCRAVVALMPHKQNLLDGALAVCEPHRNHSRAALAELWCGLACQSCTIPNLDSANAPTGCIFVGWGHGWQPCSACGGSGLSPLGNSIVDAKESR